MIAFSPGNRASSRRVLEFENHAQHGGTLQLLTLRQTRRSAKVPMAFVPVLNAEGKRKMATRRDLLLSMKLHLTAPTLMLLSLNLVACTTTRRQAAVTRRQSAPVPPSPRMPCPNIAKG